MEKEYKDVQEVLHYLQKNLKAPKSNENKFGGYKYRSCEDILEAVKPLMPSHANLIIRDDVVLIGDRFYVKAIAELLYKKESISSTAFAREQLDKKGMDAAQITGAASSYARKYALNGLLLIDDTKDADATNDHSIEVTIGGKKKNISASPVADGNHRSGNKKIDAEVNTAIGLVRDCVDLPDLKAVYTYQYKRLQEMGAHPDQLALLEMQKNNTKAMIDNIEFDRRFAERLD